ncbi:MAG: hypothetical protein ACSHX8_15755 [Opitutaceae bacterium]
MPAKKHIIVIHGRATKPSGSKKEALVRKSLLHGLERIDPSAAKLIKDKKVKLSFVYYGDISNREMVKAGKKDSKDLPAENNAKYDFKPCEDPDSYDDDLEKLFKQTSFTKASYKKFLKETPDKRGLDDAARTVSAIANFFGLNDAVVAKATPDMGAYLMTRKVGSEVRERLQAKLKPALLAGDDICLIGHSMGTMVCYDVLWKYSQMSEYRKIQDDKRKVSLWLTLGCPLGEPGVYENLYDAHESEDGKYPRDIVHDWLNISAADDFVAHDNKIANDFEKMKPFTNSIKDKKIYNFWAGSAGANPHKFYGYLDNPDVAKPIVEWIHK